jgi:hypothetical protein
MGLCAGLVLDWVCGVALVFGSCCQVSTLIAVGDRRIDDSQPSDEHTTDRAPGAQQRRDEKVDTQSAIYKVTV